MSKTLKPPPRRFPTPEAADKRKERDGFDAVQIPKIPKLTAPPAAGAAVAASKGLEPGSRNRLLAGYLAHEFLTKGTIFGEKWPPGTEPEAGEPKKEKGGAEPNGKGYQMYVAVADLLKTDGAHIPGIINPTQLGRYLRM